MGVRSYEVAMLGIMEFPICKWLWKHSAQPPPVALEDTERPRVGRGRQDPGDGKAELFYLSQCLTHSHYLEICVEMVKMLISA